jgi:hypothetical protein
MNNNSEELGGSPDAASVLKYIAEREQSLGKYSDKLRANVQRFFNIFGDPLKCQICGWSREQGHHAKYMSRKDHTFTDILPENGKIVKHDEYGIFGNPVTREEYFEEVKDIHFHIPQIRVSISMRDEHFLDEEDHDWWALDVCRNGLAIWHGGPSGMCNAKNAPLYVLKALITSGRLTAFLQDIADKLKDESEEYKEVADTAERMAQAIL